MTLKDHVFYFKCDVWQLSLNRRVSTILTKRKEEKSDRSIGTLKHDKI